MAKQIEVLIEIIDQQFDICMSFDDSEILEEAKAIAFYSAMIDAALDDPLDNAEEQSEMLDYLKKTMQDHIETYQQLVNAKLP